MASSESGTQGYHLQKRLMLYTFCMSWGSTSFGYASAIIATTLEYMNLTTANSNAASIKGALNSLFYAGGFFGCIFNSWYIDRFGRKASIGTACIIMIVSSALCAGSVNVTMFIIFRFFTGWSCLMLLIAVPLWITEIAPPQGRGVLGNIHGFMAVLGYLIASYVGVGFYYYQNGSGQQWRAPLALACLPPLITLTFLLKIPESPRFLIAKDRHDQAWRILERLHRTSDDRNGNYARTEFIQMKAQIELDRSLDSSWRILISRASYRKRALIACALLSFLYSSGTLSISNYGPSLFAGLGFSTSQTLQFQAGIILVSLSGLLVSFFVVERMPRNVLLAVGMIAVSMPLAGEAAMTAEFVGTRNKSGLAAGVAFLYIYIWFYGIFLDGPGYYYANELFPTHLRAKGATCCVASYSLVNIMWTQIAPIAFQNIGWKFYMVFISCAVVGAVVMYFFFPDTLGKPLEEVAAIFGDDDLIAIYQRDVILDKELDDDMVEKAQTIEETENKAAEKV